MMKKKYSFVAAKPVPFGKIDYWFRVGQCKQIMRLLNNKKY